MVEERRIALPDDRSAFDVVAAAVTEADPGTRLVYFVGRPGEVPQHIRQAAWVAMEAGLVELVHRASVPSHAEGARTFDYIAVVKKRRRT